MEMERSSDAIQELDIYIYMYIVHIYLLVEK